MIRFAGTALGGEEAVRGGWLYSTSGVAPEWKPGVSCVFRGPHRTLHTPH